MIDGFPSFAPSLAAASGAFDADSHHVLDRAQERSFWFRARNRLLADMTQQWFATAENVLEIGCGTGFVLGGLQQVLPRAKFVGSEVSTVGLQYANRRLGPDVALFQMDATAIPFTDTFDLIAACDVLEHLDDDRKALREIWRALKPGGGALLTVPQHPSLWSAADEFACHRRRYRRGELAEKCRAAGLNVARDTSFVASLFPLMATLRLLQSGSKSYDLQAELLPPDLINRVLFAILDMERRCIRMGASLPFGGTRVVVAFKDK